MTTNSFTLQTDSGSISTYTRTSPDGTTRVQIKLDSPQGTKTLSLYELLQLALSPKNK